MKVGTVKAIFQPVVITLETQEEVDQMFQLARLNEFRGVDSEITEKLYDALGEFVSCQQYETESDYAYHNKVMN